MYIEKRKNKNKTNQKQNYSTLFSFLNNKTIPQKKENRKIQAGYQLLIYVYVIKVFVQKRTKNMNPGFDLLEQIYVAFFLYPSLIHLCIAKGTRLIILFSESILICHNCL